MTRRPLLASIVHHLDSVQATAIAGRVEVDMQATADADIAIAVAIPAIHLSAISRLPCSKTCFRSTGKPVLF